MMRLEVLAVEIYLLCRSLGCRDAERCGVAALRLLRIAA